VRSAHFRMSVAVVAVSLGGAVLAAGAAQAAPATTIVVKSDDGVVFADQPLEVSGICAPGSTTAVVAFEQGADTIAEKSVDLGNDGAWATSLDISDATDDVATATVDCFAYGTADPIGSASEEVFVFPSDIQIFEVTVSPSKVRIGSPLTVSGSCPAGTTVASVAAGGEDADEPFLSKTVTPAADGAVSFTSKVPTKGVKPGSAVAVIACGVDAGTAFGMETLAAELPSAFGFAEFTILAAPAAAAVPTVQAPTLANTGSDNTPLLALGAALLVLGLGAYGARRVTR
jgi:LPXTG-motif cell wall-anchored protein